MNMDASHWICPECKRANHNSLIRCTCGYEATGESQISKENITLSPAHEGQEPALAPFLRSEDLSREPWPVWYILFVIPIFLIYKFTATISPYLVKDTAVVLMPWLPMTYLITVMILFETTLIAVTISILKKRHLWSQLPMMRVPIFLKEVMRAFLIVLLIALATAPINAIADLAFKDKSSTGPWEFLYHSLANPLFSLAFLLLSITLVPVAEELLFRGFLYNFLKSRWPISVAAVCQALVFALVHPYSMHGKLTVFLIGIALVIVYEKRKTLLAPIFVHGVENALPAVFIAVLLVINYHVPARTWEEAKLEPAWVTNEAMKDIGPQGDGMKQWQYAIDKWGSKGSHQWKKEINALNAVCFWYPSDRESCAKADLGIVYLYTYYLKDYRRAVVTADRLIKEYPDQKEQLASALAHKGFAYLMLEDYKNSRAAYVRVINEFRDDKESCKSARQGLNLLDKLEHK